MHLVRFVRPGSTEVMVGKLDGEPDSGSVTALPVNGGLAELLAGPVGALRSLLEGSDGPQHDAAQVTFLPPIDGRTEVWCSGVTYLRSRDGRMEESSEASIYDKVYAAERPELFMKANAWRVVTDGEPIGIRTDSGLDVPEPELAVVANGAGEIVGYTICNDMSSRSIEGENPLYLPQAKVYAGACALATGIRPAAEIDDPGKLAITMTVTRGGDEVFSGATSTDQIARPLQGLVDHLFSAYDFPDGVILATGTGIVPELSFALAAGDEVSITIESIGTLTNTVVEGKEAFAPLAEGGRPTMQ